MKTAMTPLLSVSNLQTHFKTPHGIVQAVNDVSFQLKKGEILGIVGESGSGKSVLAQSLMRVVPGT
jgi:ABC-type dipeptide/oligopeptide/nickel transport system ATPase component